jgi:hypothetical protein
MTKKLILCKGLPASGKSTWARELIDKEPEKWKRINKDDLRLMLDNNKWSKKNEQCVLKIRDLLIKQFMEDGYNIIIDDTNLDPKHEKRMREIVEKYNQLWLRTDLNESCDTCGHLPARGNVVYEDSGRRPLCPQCNSHKEKYELEVKFFDISLSEAIDRDNKRTVGHVGQKVIRGMYDRYVAPLKKIKKLDQDPSLPHCIICDLDGTITEKGDRDIYDTTKVLLDTPKEEIINIVRNYCLGKDVNYELSANNDFSEQIYIVFFSGRKEAARNDTQTWISKYVFTQDFKSKLRTEISYDLFMRKDDDNRKDSIVKKELFDEHIRGKFFVEFVLDDRNQVVEMWRNEIGLTCLQVQSGDY